MTPTKNTTKHLTRIFDELLGAGVLTTAGIALQTTDDETLAVVNRSNISTDTYLKIAADLRRRGQPLQGDLILGLPGQTRSTYKADIQFFLDHEIMPRTFLAGLLPNSPMNAPEYREEHGIVANEHQIVIATNTMDQSERSRALRFRSIEIIAERYGVLRHVLRHLQWDHGIPATEVMDRILDLGEHNPTRYPLVTWLFEHFDLFPTAPVGWRAFYAEIRSMLAAEFGLDPSASALDCVLDLQEFLMPSHGRHFPSSIPLAHDYTAYYRSATASLYTTGHAGVPDGPLASYGPATFTVVGDPLGLCVHGLRLGGGRSDEWESDFHLGQASANELESPLLRLLTVLGGEVSGIDGAAFVRQVLAEIGDPGPLTDDEGAAPTGIEVRIGATRSRATGPMTS